MTKNKINIEDLRWGGYCPWFLRYDDFTGSGNFLLFFDRLSHRIRQLLFFNESGIENLSRFAHTLDSKSLRRFRFDDTTDTSFMNYLQIEDYFKPLYVEKEIENVKNFLPIINRIGVLEVLLQIMPRDSNLREKSFFDFVKDVRSYLVEAQLMLDIDIKTYEVKLLEEPLLQKEVINKLMPRLASNFPERAKELSNAYHDMIEGKQKFDDIFIGAFKTLEALAKEITKDSSFEFKREPLRKYFPKLHQTVHDTMIKLAAHRGAEGGHGRDAPEPQEIRYLLFSICNMALLLLDYHSN